MNKRVLITGIGGFVGHHTAEHFLKNTDWDIVGLDSFRNRGDSLRLRHLKAEPRLRVHTHDLQAPISDRMIEVIGNIDFVINIASDSHVDRSISDPVPFVENNVSLMLNVLEYCRRAKPSKLIQCSTDEVFGPALEGVNHQEWFPYVPSNPYAASKAAQNAIAISYWRTFNVPLILTHTMNMIGERQDKEKFIPMLISKIAKGERVTIHGSENYIGKRMYLHCRNLSDAWLYLLREKNPALYRDGIEQLQVPDAYNVVGEVEVDNLQLAKTVAKLMGQELDYELVDFHSARPGHDRRYALDGNKISSFGWKHPIRFEDSLKKTVEWTLKNPEWLI
jgi:dTDP-glucose 4,6-dehydratase